MAEVLDPFNRKDSLKEITELQKLHINREEGGAPVRGRHTVDHVAKLPSGGSDHLLPAETEVHEALDQYAKTEQQKYGKRQLAIAKEFVKQAEAEAEQPEQTDAA